MALPANPLATEQQICIDYNRQSIKLAAMYLFHVFISVVFAFCWQNFLLQRLFHLFHLFHQGRRQNHSVWMEGKYGSLNIIATLSK